MRPLEEATASLCPPFSAAAAAADSRDDDQQLPVNFNSCCIFLLVQTLSQTYATPQSPSPDGELNLSFAEPG